MPSVVLRRRGKRGQGIHAIIDVSRSLFWRQMNGARMLNAASLSFVWAAIVRTLYTPKTRPLVHERNSRSIV